LSAQYATAVDVMILPDQFKADSRRHCVTYPHPPPLQLILRVFVDIVSKRSTDALDDSALKAHSPKLEKVLSSQTQSDTNSSDVDGLGLFDELRTLRNIMPDSVDSFLIFCAIYIRVFAWGLSKRFSCFACSFNNPVTVASGQRSFSKLKLIKTYLRASIKQDRLNGLALLSIENAVASELDYSSVIEKFASLGARRGRIWVFELRVSVKLHCVSKKTSHLYNLP